MCGVTYRAVGAVAALGARESGTVQGVLFTLVAQELISFGFAVLFVTTLVIQLGGEAQGGQRWSLFNSLEGRVGHGHEQAGEKRRFY